MKLTILLGHLSLLVTYSNAGLPSSTTTIKRDLVPDEACVDSSLKFRVEDDTSISYKSCKWVKDKITQRCSIEGVRLHCPKSCNTCGTDKCEDGTLKFKYETGSKNTSCMHIKRHKSKCTINGVSEVCRSSCEYCALPPDSLQDSKYKFKIKSTKDHIRCSELTNENDLCNDQDVQSHCPVTCGSPKMCSDSQVKFKTKKNGFKYCWELGNICGNLDGRLTCRYTCEVCKPDAPSELDTMVPSGNPSISCQDSEIQFKTVDGSGNHYQKKCSAIERGGDKKTVCGYDGVDSHCPVTCGRCDRCVDSSLQFKPVKGSKDWYSCFELIDKCGTTGISHTCRASCGICKSDSSEPSIAPTSVPTCYGGSGLGAFENIAEVPTCLLKECAGNCQQDYDCIEDLVCHPEKGKGSDCKGTPFLEYRFCVEPVEA